MTRTPQRRGWSAVGDAPLGREDLAGLAANDNGSDDDELRLYRFEAKIGHGFSAFEDCITSMPEIGVSLLDSDPGISLGWRLGLAQRGSNSLEFGIEAARRILADDDLETEQLIEFRLRARWQGRSGSVRW